MALNGLRQRLRNASGFSTEGKVLVIIALFILISLLLQSLIYLQGSVFAGVRSYVRGEGLWAKGQKDAVLYLTRYSYSQDPADFQAYERAVGITLGDRQARLALLQSPPDIKSAQAGFLQGGNDPTDIDSLIWFFLNFRQISYMRDAVDVWIEADAKIDQLLETAQQLRREVETDGNRPERVNNLRDRLQSLNDELLELENRFSKTLGIGARWVRVTTWRISLVFLLLIVSLAFIVSRQILRGIAQAEHQLLTSESRFRSLLESDTIGILSWRTDGTIDDANDHFLNMLGLNADDLRQGRISWLKLTPPQYHERDQQAVAQLLAEGRCDPYEKEFLHKDGHAVPIYVGSALLQGEKDQGIAYVMDLSERKQTEAQLRLAATVFTASNDGVLIMDSFMKVISANQALCRMTGFNEEELKNKLPRALQSVYTTPLQYRDMLDSLYRHGHWEGEVVDRKKNGAVLLVRVSLSSVRKPQGEVTHYVAILSDITERKAEEAQLRHIAHHDALTGLPNRTLFHDRIEQVIKRAERSQHHFAVVFLDLNDFKPVNDQYGHEVGDKLLQTVADRLIHAVRGSDTVTRLGGDEFVLLLEDVADRVMVDSIVTKILASVCAPWSVDEATLQISASVGIALYPEDGTDKEALLHHADTVMYSMKRQSRRGSKESIN